MLNSIFPKYIVDKIITILIPVNEIQDKVIRKFTFDRKFTKKKPHGQTMTKSIHILKLNFYVIFGKEISFLKSN